MGKSKRLSLTRLLRPRTAGAFPASPILRRRSVMAWMQLAVVALLVVALAALFLSARTGAPFFAFYLVEIVVLVVVLGTALIANVRGWYFPSALLTVAVASIAPWLSLMFDTRVLEGDLVPLTYIAPSLMLSAILLKPVMTIAFSVAQFVALSLLAYFTQLPGGNWASLLTLIPFVAAIAIVSNILSARDIRQLDEQAALLQLSRDELHEETVRDPLTSLFNRRHLVAQIDREVLKSANFGSSFGLVMLDLDHFKEVNDDLGHAAGDAVLRGIADVLKSSVRSSDELCWIGGDEFVVLLPNATVETVSERAHNLVISVRQWSRTQQGPAAQITVSAGAFHWPGGTTTTMRSLQRTDEALYQAKKNGRDRVQVAS